jgi:hypothetical protein
MRATEVTANTERELASGTRALVPQSLAPNLPRPQRASPWTLMVIVGADKPGSSL